MRYRVEIRSVPEDEEWLLDQFGVDKDHIFSQMSFRTSLRPDGTRRENTFDSWSG